VTGALRGRHGRGASRTVASRFVEPRGFSGGVLAIEHPTGRIEVDLVTDRSGPAPVVERASFVRTARRILTGTCTCLRRCSTDREERNGSGTQRTERRDQRVEPGHRLCHRRGAGEGRLQRPLSARGAEALAAR